MFVNLTRGKLFHSNVASALKTLAVRLFVGVDTRTQHHVVKTKCAGIYQCREVE